MKLSTIFPDTPDEIKGAVARFLIILYFKLFTDKCKLMLIVLIWQCQKSHNKNQSSIVRGQSIKIHIKSIGGHFCVNTFNSFCVRKGMALLNFTLYIWIITAPFSFNTLPSNWNHYFWFSRHHLIFPLKTCFCPFESQCEIEQTCKAISTGCTSVVTATVKLTSNSTD